MIKNWRLDWLTLAILAFLLSILIAVFGTKHMMSSALHGLHQRGTNTLGLAAAALAGQLARYEKLPPLIAEHDTIQNLIRDPDRANVEAVNKYLRSINTLLESSDIYLMDEKGITIAASNYIEARPFIGENFDYRPYFYDAIAGNSGRFFALGTTSGKRGYYFSSPVMIDGQPRGVLAFKVDMDVIEQSWHGSDFEIIVTDPESIIFMSGRSEWLFKSIGPLSADQIARTATTRRYAETPLVEIPVQSTRTAQGDTLLEMNDTNRLIEYLILSEEMADAGWTVSVLLTTRSARNQAYTSVLALLLLVGLGAMAIAIFLQNRTRLAERLAAQREIKEQLEFRVSARTVELADANKKLATEVDERRATERQLRQTQVELVHAGKLAALGQMSAALSHEFNQPLAAVRAYAEVSGLMLDQGRDRDAKAGLDRILKVVERMTSISKHLRNFARRPRKKLRPVKVQDVIRDTKEIISWRLSVGKVDLSLEPQNEAVWVVADSVRLQQVLVNIISNAADAVEGQETRFIGVSLRAQDDKVLIYITDNGPGVPDAIAARIYDPFFSTKGVGKGLGLGLSISYNIVKDFNGELSVRNLPEGGAEFCISLDKALPPAEEETGKDI